MHFQILVAALFAQGICAYQWQTVPKRVQDLERNLTINFEDRSALLWGTADGVVGGTGSANGPLVFLSCAQADCFPDGMPVDFVGVVEEDTLATMLPALAASLTPAGSSLPLIPSALLVLPGPPETPFSPAAQNPLAEYAPAGARALAWNAGGSDLLQLTLPSAVFLVPSALAGEVRSKAKRNEELGFRGPLFGAEVDSETQMDETSNSITCIEQSQCLPLGGYSVWVSMPPLSANSSRPQIVVLTHWDGSGLFRNSIDAVHSGYSGLISMLIAADVLSTQQRGGQAASAALTHDILFVSLTAESVGLTGSRRLLFELDQGNNSTAGIDLSRVEAIVEVGMTGAPPSEGASRLWVHAATAASAAAQVLVNASAAVPDVEVSMSSQEALPPSSLRLWSSVAPPAVDSVYLGDFDSTFNNEVFWSYKDQGRPQNFSSASVARAGVVLAYTLRALASGSPVQTVANATIDDAATALANTLSGCLISPGGLACDLVQSMTSTTAPTAERRPPVLQALTADPQLHSIVRKNNIERFTWEFLTNRTFTGEAEDTVDSEGQPIGCDPLTNVCTDGKVCMHLTPSAEEQLGQCVTATSRFVPSLSTRLTFTDCAGQDASCQPWSVTPGTAAADFAAQSGLPPDPVWTETFNEPLAVAVSLRETHARDIGILLAGLFATAVSVIAVAFGKTAYSRHLKTL